MKPEEVRKHHFWCTMKWKESLLITHDARSGVLLVLPVSWLVLCPRSIRPHCQVSVDCPQWAVLTLEECSLSDIRGYICQWVQLPLSTSLCHSLSDYTTNASLSATTYSRPALRKRWTWNHSVFISLTSDSLRCRKRIDMFLVLLIVWVLS